MKDIMKGIYLMTAILLIALALPFGTSSVSAQGESVGTALPSVSAQEESYGIIIGFYGGGITQEPATETMVQIAIAHMCEVNDELILEKVEICGESKIPVKTFDVNGTLESVADGYDQLKLLLEKFESTPDEEIRTQAAALVQDLRSKSFSTGYFTLDLNDLKQPLTLGDRVPIIAKATFIHHGEALVIERNLTLEYQPGLLSSPHEGQTTNSALELQTTSSLPELQNWKKGVQHVHTGHSELDWIYVTPPFPTPPTVRQQAQAAKDAGLSWIIITDHEEMLSAQEWLEERGECAQAEAAVGIQVMCGEEVGSVSPTTLLPIPIPIPPFFIWGRGHYLAYDIDSYITWPWYKTTQQMINEVNSSNGGGGFGFIAHPFEGPQFWLDWTAAGYTGLEIMNGSTASDGAINKWTQILTNPGARIFAIGNSDAHLQEEVANAYVYCDIGEAVTHSSVYSALENGHSVVTNGPLIAFTIGDKKIGDTLTTAYSNAFLDIAWDAQQSGVIQRIELYSNQGLVKNQTVSGTTTGSTSLMISVTSQTLYVRLRAIFSNGEAYTNPIWIVYTPPSGGGCPFLQVWDGSDYIDEGLLDIHNAEDVDVIYEHTLTTVPESVNGTYAFRLIEHPKTISDIDQVQLRAILEDGTVKELPLKTAWHSEDGNVRNLLLKSDDRRVEEKGADHNGGTSQSIDLTFKALRPGTNVIAFIFTIEGYNMICKTCV